MRVPMVNAKTMTGENTGQSLNEMILSICASLREEVMFVSVELTCRLDHVLQGWDRRSHGRSLTQ